MSYPLPRRKDSSERDMHPSSRLSVLLVSPGAKGGSFLATAQPLEELGLTSHAILATLDDVKERTKRFKKVFALPWWPGYNRFGLLTADNPLGYLIYNLPLYFLASGLVLIFKPKLVIANGLLTVLPVLPIARLWRSRVILSHHAQLEFYVRPGILRILAAVIEKFVEYAVVNSRGSREDLTKFVDRRKIIVVEHMVPKTFFAQRDRTALRTRMKTEGELVVFYSGWLNREKRCDKVLQLAASFRDEDSIQFWFAGDGELRTELMELCQLRRKVRYFGYIRSEEELAKLYTAADIVWSVAETTYVARPGVEALACGTPIVVPLVPGVLTKAAKGTRVPRDLLPIDVGWVVDDENVSNLADFIIGLIDRKKTEAMRTNCKNYAIANHSPENASRLFQIISETAGVR